MNTLFSRVMTAMVPAVLGASLSTLSAATVTLNPVADTSLMQNNPNNNLGEHTSIPSGTTAGGAPTRLLLRFDPTAKIPANAVITSASLKMVVNKENFVAPDAQFELHRMLVDWVEGSGAGQTGEPASSGETTWNKRIVPGVSWGAPGGQAGVDFSTTVSATKLITSPGAQTFATSAALVSDVQAWVSSSASNFGWMLICAAESKSSTARRFASREDSVSAPVLTVSFDAPAPELKVSVARQEPSAVVLSWTKVAAPYQLQRKSDLQGAWTDVGAPTSELSATVPATDAAAYFRVISAAP